MHLRTLLCARVAVLLLGEVSAARGASTDDEAPSRPSTRPNIVLIVGDDHGWPYYGFMGSKTVKTPRLDQLAASGTVFPFAYNTASRCRPSLRSILTGLQPHQFKLRAGEVRRQLRAQGLSASDPIRHIATLPRLLERAGYATYQAGKLWDGVCQNSGFGDGMTKTPNVAATRFVANAAGYELGRKTMDPVFSFLENHRDEPFFLWFAPQLPHRPFDAPAELQELYPKSDFSPAARAYFANCTWEDQIVGALLDHLDRKGLRENTLIVYLSDNGWEQVPRAGADGFASGEHGKGSVHELGLRTPLVFAWPGHIPVGRRIDEFVSTTDLFPTILGLAGVKIPGNRAGIDLMPTMTGHKPTGRDRLVGAQFVDPDPRRERPYRTFRGDTYFVRDREWYYVLWGGKLNRDMLFDKKADPDERKNVAHLHPDRAAAYREIVLDWLDEIGVGRRRVGWLPAALALDVLRGRPAASPAPIETSRPSETTSRE